MLDRLELAVLEVVETEAFRDFVMRTLPNSKAAFLLDKYRPAMYPTDNLRDLGSPAPGVRVIGAPDGIPDVGTINYGIVSERRGHQYSGRVDQNFRGGQDKLRGSYYMTRIVPETVYLRPAFDHPFPHRNQFMNLGYTRIFAPIDGLMAILSQHEMVQPVARLRPLGTLKN